MQICDRNCKIRTVPSSSTLSSEPHGKFIVFLSFKSEDTCFNFTHHLFHATENLCIIPFGDDEELGMGEFISQVIIFSENYASSIWCMGELVQIIECRNGGQSVLSIFYPPRMTFEEAFAKHKKLLKENLQKGDKWRVALRQVTKISRLHLEKG